MSDSTTARTNRAVVSWFQRFLSVSFLCFGCFDLSSVSGFSRNSLLFSTRIRRKQHRRTYWDLMHPKATSIRSLNNDRNSNRIISSRLLVLSSLSLRSQQGEEEEEEEEEKDDGSPTNNSLHKSRKTKKALIKKKRSPLRRAVRIYADYAQRLWNETTPQVRQEIARDQATAAIKRVQAIFLRNSTTQDNAHAQNDPIQVQNLLNACEALLLEQNYPHEDDTSSQSLSDVEDPSLTMKETYKTDSLDSTNGESNSIASHSAPAPKVLLQQDLPLEEETFVVSTSGPPQTTEQPPSLKTDSDQTTKALAIVQNDKAVSNIASDTSSPETKPPKKRRSIWFGAVMGMAVACWVFSGNYIFTGLFTLMTILGQLEYYRMVINTGVYPARRISVVGACSMFLTALFCPQHHQITLPLAGLYSMIWFLVAKREVTTIPEIATTFTGMFYLGYVPSFWVRIRLIGAGREPTRLAPLVGPLIEKLHWTALTKLPDAVYPKAIHLPITTGAIFIFWTWLCLAFSDVGAYFVGKNFGRTKLGSVAPAAGATSPNKTVEGVLGGCAVSAALGMLGAWVQKWPFWAMTGMIHGTILGLLGLLGDLTASMIKRDAGIKDFGDLIPEHGGILDRVDSFVWSAPYSWLVCHTIIPALKNAFR